MAVNTENIRFYIRSDAESAIRGINDWKEGGMKAEFTKEKKREEEGNYAPNGGGMVMPTHQQQTFVQFGPGHPNFNQR